LTKSNISPPAGNNIFLSNVSFLLKYLGRIYKLPLNNRNKHLYYSSSDVLWRFVDGHQIRVEVVAEFCEQFVDVRSTEPSVTALDGRQVPADKVASTAERSSPVDIVGGGGQTAHGGQARRDNEQRQIRPRRTVLAAA